MRRTGGRRVAALTATLATAAGLLIALPTLSVASPSTPPPNPTDSQLSGAASHKDAVAGRIGVLSGQIAQAQSQLDQLQGEKELAEQKVAYAVSKLRDAQVAADQARARVQKAADTVKAAHTKFVQYLQASYMDGAPTGTAGSLLTASDPNTLLDQSSLQQYEAVNKVDAIGVLQRASVTKSNADAGARKAVYDLGKKTDAAKAAKQAADDRVEAEAQQKAGLETTKANSQTELDAAQLQLATLQGQRATFVAYTIEQARLARIAAAAAKARRERAARIAEQQAAAFAAARARAHRHHSSGGGGGGGHSGDGGSSASIVGPPAPTGGGWTAAKGRNAVSRARSALGTPYAWAGGGVSGPGTGVCDASNGAPNDCYVSGFDCSGLVLYAWGRHWDHYAASQYTQTGAYHPPIGSLKPGDLLFWSGDGTIGGIHHVAIYIGAGQIIQAPFSGGYVEISPMYDPGSIFGATRPLT